MRPARRPLRPAVVAPLDGTDRDTGPDMVTPVGA